MKTIIIIMLSLYTSLVFGQVQQSQIRISVKPSTVQLINVLIKDEPAQSIKPNAKGLFVWETKLAQAKEITLKINGGYDPLLIYLEPGDNLQIDTDFKGHSTFSGKGKENAALLQEFMQLYYKSQDTLAAYSNAAPPVYYAHVARMNKEQLDFLAANKNRVSRGFYQYQYIKWYYEALRLDIIIPYMYSMQPGMRFSKILPSGYMDLMQKVTLDDNLLQHPSYRQFIKTLPNFFWFRYLYQKGILNREATYPGSERQKMAYQLAKQELKGKIRDLAMYNCIQELLTWVKDARPYKSFIEQYKADGGSKTYVKKLEELYQQATRLNIGDALPDFTLDDLNGKKVSLKDFKGKVLYIDFWASWCGPCRAQMQNASPKLHAKFKDNPEVVFLYISFDSKVADWKKAINDDKIEGVHLLSQATSGLDTPLAEALNINGIPRYMIIGKDGKVLDTDAPRPSQEETESRIREALK